MTLLRPIGPGDREFVLALNQEHVELLAPLDDSRLSELIDWSDMAAVIGDQAGFVITLAGGTAYDSPNYRWFAERHPAFYYLDRVVLSVETRRTGLGSSVYDELEGRAQTLAPVMCLEVNLDPPNEPSLAFHRNRGYVEVGQGEMNGHTVSLMTKRLDG